MSTTPLRVAVVGGGIGGAAAAYALLRRGLDVRLYEQAPALKEVGAGVAVQPNGVRMLERLGLGEDFRRLAARWIDPQFRRPDGAPAASMFKPEIADRIEFYGVHRADLLSLLVDRLPASIVHPGHRCAGFEQDGAGAHLTFDNGARVTADVVIAADGIHSSLQKSVVAPSPPIYSGTVAYRGTIPIGSVAWAPGRMRSWLGPGKHFLVFPVRANAMLNFVGFLTSDEPVKESWSGEGAAATLAEAYAGWDPLVQDIIAQMTTVFRSGLYDREPLPKWTEGRLTLLGDAAHPMLPHTGQGANQAIEDGVALAALLARADRATAPAALATYERLRRERTAGVQRISRVNGARYDAASGDLAERDRQLDAQPQERAWIWNHDAEAEAETAQFAA